MTIIPRCRRALVPTITLCALVVLSAIVPSPADAKASTVVRTSESVGGLAWASAANGRTFVGTFASTLDRGATWTPAQDHEIGDLDPQLRWATGTDASGTLGSDVIQSTDGGSTWHRLDSFDSAEAVFAGLGSVNVVDVLVDPTRHGTVYAIVDDFTGKTGVVGVIESSDSGATWTTWRTLLDDNTYAGAALDVREILGRDALLVGRAVPSGVQSPASATDSIATPTSLTPIRHAAGTEWTGRIEVDRSGSRLLLQTSAGWRLSNDDGTNAHGLVLAGPIAPVFDPSGRGRLFALRRGTLFHSLDEGRHWVRRGTARGATGLAVDRGGRLVYAYGANGVWISSDAGATLRHLGHLAGPLPLEPVRGSSPSFRCRSRLVSRAWRPHRETRRA